MPPNVLITGACGYLGTMVLRAMATQRERFGNILALDVRLPTAAQRQPGVEYDCVDVRDPDLRDRAVAFGADTVIHLASIVTPGKDSSAALEYSVDVLGTENVLAACVAAGTRQIIVTSSGAAYGYHADNPAWLREEDALRGNEAFAYARHKRLVEEMLARYRQEHPALGQLVFRVCTILGAETRNQITALFEKRVLLGVAGASTPFVFVWDEDAARAIAEGAARQATGIFNLAGDGALDLATLARLLGKRRVLLPPGLLATALRVLQGLGLTRYGPEQVDFLRYRPVLDNARLKQAFGFIPQKSSLEAFEYYLAHNVHRRH